MAIFHSLPIALGMLSLAWLIRKYQYRSRLRGHVLPPGPKRWPVIGNLFDIPVKEPWTVFRSFSEKFGDIVYVEALGNPMVILSSSEVAFDLLDKRSAIYSDRPRSPMDKILGWEWNMGLMPYGPQWKDIRRCFHQYFSPLTSPKYRDAHVAMARTFLKRVSQAGGRVSEPLLRLMVASSISDVIYGMSIRSLDDKYIQNAEAAVRILNEAKLPGAYWLDFFPLLKYMPAWIPGAKAQQLGARSRPLVARVREWGFEYARSHKDTKDCVASDLITQLESNKQSGSWLSEEVAMNATGVAYAAAVDTTLSFQSFFFVAMALHPDIQRKAQAELDRVVGQDRLPDFDDLKSLPFLMAVLFECTRWVTIAPLVIPHRVMKDDYYKEYFIPAGSVIFANVQIMLHDPKDYPEPDRFNPDRFIKDGKLNPGIRDPTTLAFGFGRRLCPGRYFAKDQAFILLASTLHAYNILPGVDEHGNALDPTPIGGVVVKPMRLACALTPRSEAVAKLVASTC